MTISLEDRLNIHELLALYGHIIDDRQFSRLGEIFTVDAIFDLSGYGGPRYSGLEEIEDLMVQSTEHPLAHHATNIVISADEADVGAISKGLGVGHRGKVGSVVYRDTLVQVNDKWRISQRQVELRRSSSIPAIS